MHLGQRLSLNCTASSYHIIDLIEIGNRDTTLTYNEAYYIPQDCTHDNDNTSCTKTIDITVTADMHQKAYQCRIFRRGESIYYYSEGGYVQGKLTPLSLTYTSS